MQFQTALFFTKQLLSVEDGSRRKARARQGEASRKVAAGGAVQ